MQVRQIGFDDLPAAIALAQEFVASSPAYQRYPFDEDTMRSTLTAAVACPNYMFGAVAESAGSVVGFMLGAVTQMVFSPAKQAGEIVLYVAPSHRGTSAAVRLVQAFERWAVERGATLICAGVSAGINDAVGVKLYTRLGFIQRGVGFAKEV